MQGDGSARAAGTRREYVPIGSTAAIPAADDPGPWYRSDLNWTPMDGTGLLFKQPSADSPADLSLLQLIELSAYQPGPAQFFQGEPADPALRFVTAAEGARLFSTHKEAFTAVLEALRQGLPNPQKGTTYRHRLSCPVNELCSYLSCYQYQAVTSRLP